MIEIVAFGVCFDIRPCETLKIQGFGIRKKAGEVASDKQPPMYLHLSRSLCFCATAYRCLRAGMVEGLWKDAAEVGHDRSDW